MGAPILPCPHTMESTPDLLCSLASLILADAQQDVTADNINTLVKAAGASVPAYYAALFEKVNGNSPFAETVELASKVGGGDCAAAPAAASTKGGAPAAAAKEESEEEEEAAPAGDLFGGGGDDY